MDAGLPPQRPVPVALIAAATQAWRAARDGGVAPQPMLHAVLTPSGYDMLAPAIDSLMTLGEACLGRPLCHGCGQAHDADTAMLCALLADPAALSTCGGGGWRPVDAARGTLFANALASTRTMLGNA